MTNNHELALREFVEAARAYCAAIETGRSKQANEQVKAATDAYRKLKDCGELAKTALLALLSSEDEGVRYMAAVHVLDFAAEEAERVLVDITRGPPRPVRLLAITSLSQWRSGLLRF